MKKANEDNLDFSFNEITGEVLRNKREKNNYSLKQLAEKVGITRQALFRYETNQSRIKNDVFKDICYALNEEPQSVFEEIQLKFAKYGKMLSRERKEDSKNV